MQLPIRNVRSKGFWSWWMRLTRPIDLVIAFILFIFSIYFVNYDDYKKIFGFFYETISWYLFQFWFFEVRPVKYILLSEIEIGRMLRLLEIQICFCELTKTISRVSYHQVNSHKGLEAHNEASDRHRSSHILSIANQEFLECGRSELRYRMELGLFSANVSNFCLDVLCSYG